jgi:superfamily II DNA or RNA helicase
MRKELRPYQIKAKDDIFNAWEAGHKNVLLVLPTGMGKCLGRDTPIVMFDGTVKQVQDVIVGDLLMGPDSLPKKVLSTCHGQSELFRITPVKGDSWVCNDVHVLSLRHTETNETIDIPLNEYQTKTKNFKHLHKQFRTGVLFNSNPTEFEPYLLGVYLTEGTWRYPQITNPDIEVIQYLMEWAEKNNTKIRMSAGNGCVEMYFSDFISGWGKNKIRKLAKLCTSQDDRWIPKEHLINSREHRLNVLAGLLDGDGHLTEGCFEIITKYPSLSRDILFLARSLGFAAYSSIKIGKIKSTGFEGNYFRIVISGHINQIPTKIKRKKAKPRKQIKDVLNTGFSVDSIGVGDYFGFTLNGDGRFLLGDFTVTHNTVSFCSIAIDMALDPKGLKLPTAIFVHRKELVQQISLTLAEENIVHNIIAPRPVIKGIVAAQRRLLGKQFYDYNAPITVISLDTLNARIIKHEKWAKSIRFWITDEAAHLLRSNKWGRAIGYFENAIGLGVTATPQRLDKRGLGRHADGVFDVMVQGPNTRWGIDNGHLSKYKVAVPASDYGNYLEKATEGADYSKQAMTVASEKSHIVGDVVENYKKFANGKQAILFASDIATAERMESEFLEAGITAKLLTGMSEDKERLDAMIEYREKKIKVLLNVDLFDEGLDVPGIECVIMARPTMSLSKYLQMIGRGLRPLKGKEFLVVIDHVGNVSKHGLPCKIRKWTLNRISKRKPKINLIRICENPVCSAPFDRMLTECPYCGTEVSKAPGEGRTPPIQVDGDLHLMDPETLREIEKGIHLEDPERLAARVEMAAGIPASKRAYNNQVERIETQRQLIEAIAQWAGIQRAYGISDRSIHKKFYIEQGKTINESLSEPRKDMLETIEGLKEEVSE